MSGRDDEVGPSGLSVKEMDIADCPVQSVVVYQDRAEVSQQACALSEPVDCQTEL